MTKTALRLNTGEEMRAQPGRGVLHKSWLSREKANTAAVRAPNVLALLPGEKPETATKT
jgi:hypothetical protein